MNWDEARLLYSDYLENALDEPTRAEMQAFLAAQPDCAADLARFDRTLATLRGLPSREPVLDMWQEFAPKVESYRLERRLALWPRLHQQWLRLMSQLSAGVILWTQALAARTHARLERHLLHDPLHSYQQEKL